MNLSDLLFDVTGADAQLCLTFRIKAGLIDKFRRSIDAIDPDWQYTVSTEEEGKAITIRLTQTGERA